MEQADARTIVLVGSKGFHINDVAEMIMQIGHELTSTTAVNPLALWDFRAMFDGRVIAAAQGTAPVILAALREALDYVSGRMLQSSIFEVRMQGWGSLDESTWFRR